jgi:hypothetical protein
MLKGKTSANTSALTPRTHSSHRDLPLDSFSPVTSFPDFRDVFSLSNTLLIVSSESDVCLADKTKKTEVITSAAWLST